MGYVPSLKEKHESKIVGSKAIESKGGSIRYTLQGEYEGRKTLPKTVSKADFEGVYGFDAKEAEAVIIHGKKGSMLRTLPIAHKVGVEDKDGFTPTYIDAGNFKDGINLREGLFENHADTVGSPSPASVEPPAPSDTPFPQEPSNENFSADNPSDYAYEPTDEEMAEIWEREQKMRDLEPIELLEDDDYTTLEGTLEKEAFGFGKDEEEAEPKTQEFTVVLQEGDKLELTDIEEDVSADDEPKEEDSPEESENEEKEAEKEEERWALGLDHRQGVRGIHTVGCSGNKNTYFQEGRGQNELIRNWREDSDTFTSKQIAQEIYTNLENSESLDERRTGNTLKELIKAQSGLIKLHNCCKKVNTDNLLSTTFIVDLDAESYEAVSAKVTRPAKEEEEEETEDGEGLSTLAKVGIGLGALAVGAVVLGAEDGESDYWAGESASWRAENVSGAESYSADQFPSMHYGDHNSDAQEKYQEFVGEWDGDDDPPSFEEWSMMDFDPDYEITDEQYEDMERVQEEDYQAMKDAETFEAGNMMVKLQEVDGEAPYYNCPYCRNELTVLGGKGGIVAVCENESRCNGLEIPRQYLDDYEKYHWYVNERSSAENFSADAVYITGKKDNTPTTHLYIEGKEDDTGFEPIKIYDKTDSSNVSYTNASNHNKKMGKIYEAESKEAESKNLKMALGITAVGIGLAAVLGKDKITKLFDRFGL
jgi:hypothetical protein